MTLVRAISKLGLASRSQARIMISSGKVCVNGKTVRDPDFWLSLRDDGITVEGKKLRPQSRVYLLMNKPCGIITTRSDELGRQTVYDLLPADATWVFPVGRLDQETSGALLFTNDTRFGEAVTSENVPKRYQLELDRSLSEADRRIIERGMTLHDGTPLRPVKVRVSGKGRHMYELILREGKNRQIRRMFDRLGYGLLSLSRIAIGDVVLGRLPEGAIRQLTEKEVESLLRPYARKE